MKWLDYIGTVVGIVGALVCLLASNWVGALWAVAYAFMAAQSANLRAQLYG